MPAEIDSMAFVGQVPWHRLGTKLESPATAAEAMAAAGMGWDVQLQPLYTGPDRTVKIRDRFAVCRADRLEQADGGQLGVVGRNFTPLQNREAFTFLDPLVGEGAAIYHTAGSLRGGRRIWMLAKLPGEIRVIGDDIAEKFILLSNSHDGTAAVRIGLTPIRVVCMNTLNLALSGMAGLTIRHHSDVVQRVRQAHELLGLVNSAMDTAGQIMQAMARTPLDGGRMRDYFQQVMPVPAEDDLEQRAKIQQRHGRLAELFETGIGTDLPGVRGTLWAAYNAVTEWTDRESYTARNREPLNSIWFGDGERLKRSAFDVATRFLQRAAMN